MHKNVISQVRSISFRRRHTNVQVCRRSEPSEAFQASQLQKDKMTFNVDSDVEIELDRCQSSIVSSDHQDEPSSRAI